ncbi:MAG: lipopolysaccharide heptosyltransferase II [Betaproteobacteria bacterium]|nr:lipopolysaccharide heptosyltransferase II [Betaproteobacteria bacterium]
MRRILIVAPSWVGDTVMAQPLFARLHERHRQLALDVLAPERAAALLAHMPEVADVLPHTFAHGELRLGDRYRLARAIRARAYDQAIVLPNSLKSALIPFLARIPLRTGFVGEMRRGLVNDARTLDPRAYPLMVERYALLGEAAGLPLTRPLAPPCLRVDPQASLAILERLGVSASQPAAALCVGAEYGPAKRWPAGRFAELAQALLRRGHAVWLIGSPKDAPVGAEIAQAAGQRVVNLCGRTDLEEAIGLLSHAAFVVTNDSGLMHVAAALGKPLVALYGSSTPAFTPPLSPTARVLSLNLPCSPCFKRECPLGHYGCLVGLSAERVLHALPPELLGPAAP